MRKRALKGNWTPAPNRASAQLVFIVIVGPRPRMLWLPRADGGGSRGGRSPRPSFGADLQELPRYVRLLGAGPAS